MEIDQTTLSAFRATLRVSAGPRLGAVGNGCTNVFPGYFARARLSCYPRRKTLTAFVHDGREVASIAEPLSCPASQDWRLVLTIGPSVVDSCIFRSNT